MHTDRIFLAVGAMSVGLVAAFFFTSRSSIDADVDATPAPLVSQPHAAPSPLAEEPAAQPSSAASSAPDVDRLYATCATGNWPTAQDAESRISACSQALLTHKLSPNQVAVARLMRAQARAALGNHVLTASDFTEASRQSEDAVNPDNAASLDAYRRATVAYGQGNLAVAINDYSEAIKIDPDNALAHLGRGVMLASRERSFARAVEDFDRVIAIGHDKLKMLVPGDDLYLFALVSRGEAYGQLGQLGHSLADFNRAIALAPNAAKPYMARAELRVRRGETMLALQDYERALSLEPRNATALSQRAALYASEGHFAQAIADLDVALITYPDSAELLYNRGYAHFWHGDLTKALADYDAALALSPSMVRALTNRCLTRVTLNANLEGALADCNAAVQIEPDNAAARETRGLAYLKLGKPDAASADFATVLEADPNRPISLYGRAVCRSVDSLAASLQQAAAEDREAAFALDPAIGKSFARLGLH